MTERVKALGFPVVLNPAVPPDRAWIVAEEAANLTPADWARLTAEMDRRKAALIRSIPAARVERAGGAG